MVARAELRFDAEPVRGVDVSECLERDHVHVLQGLLRHGLAEVESKRIPDSAPAGDVRRRKRLVSQEQSADVVPAREVLCADDRLPTRSQDSLGLADEVIESLHMLDDLVRVHDVDRGILERPGVVEVTDPDVETPPTRASCLLRDDLHTADVLGSSPESTA